MREPDDVTTVYAPWMCVGCGYTMDAASGAYDRKAVPKRGDVSMCLNCGKPYRLRGKLWRPLTAQQFDRLPDYLKDQVRRAQLARALANLPDLAGGGGHT